MEKVELAVKISAEKGFPMNNQIRQQSIDRGYGEIVEVVHTATIMHSGWASDKEGWIVKMKNGKMIALTTNHGSLTEWDIKSMTKTVKETLDSAQSVQEAIDLMSSSAKGRKTGRTRNQK